MKEALVSQAQEVVVELVIEEFLQVYSGEVVARGVEEALVVEEVAEEMLSRIMRKEIGFQI